jgi:hypothetical protein
LAFTVPFSFSVGTDIPNLKITSILLNGVELTVGNVLPGINQTGYIQPFTNGTVVVKWSGTPDHQTMGIWRDSQFSTLTMHSEFGTVGYSLSIPACNSFLWIQLLKF